MSFDLSDIGWTFARLINILYDTMTQISCWFRIQLVLQPYVVEKFLISEFQECDKGIQINSKTRILHFNNRKLLNNFHGIYKPANIQKAHSIFNF